MDGKEYSVWFDETGCRSQSGIQWQTRFWIKPLSWERCQQTYPSAFKSGEYAPQSMTIDVARDNALKNTHRHLLICKKDMAEGVAEIVFDEADLPHLLRIYPEITDYLTGKLQDPGWLSGTGKTGSTGRSLMRRTTLLCVSIIIIGQYLQTVPEVCR